MSTQTEFRAEWLKNLRSGAYPQTRNSLVRNDDSSCCLGVAARMLNPESDAVELRDIHITETATSRYSNISEALGFTSEQVDTLVSLNDDKYLSFPEIADYVDQHFG